MGKGWVQSNVSQISRESIFSSFLNKISDLALRLPRLKVIFIFKNAVVTSMSLKDEETGPSPQHKGMSRTDFVSVYLFTIYPIICLGSSNYDDPSGKIFSVYNMESEKHDRALAEGWKSDMDGILIFVCGGLQILKITYNY